MSIADGLGDLVYVDPKEYFKDEAKVFTPWVSTDGLDLLSRALKVQLELVGTERPVGSFKADIECEDPDYGTVLIENQLTISDHKHAGQLITYAPGIGEGTGADTVVWVAPRFRPEHRAAIGWLNRLGEAYKPQVRFFGVEIELWRIGSSMPAPNFVVVAHPEDWERPKTDSRPGEKTRGVFFKEYWTSLKEHLEDSECTVSLFAPAQKAFIDAPLGLTGCSLRSSISVLKTQTKVDLVIIGENAEAYGHLLHRQKDEIDGELGVAVELDWKIPPDWSNTTISTASTGWNLEDRNQWSEQFKWFVEHLNEFDRVFGPRVRAINPADYTPDESDDPDEDTAGDESE